VPALSNGGAQSIDAGRASGVTGALAGELDGIAGRVQKKQAQSKPADAVVRLCLVHIAGSGYSRRHGGANRND
jgi:hypothetical protein